MDKIIRVDGEHLTIEDVVDVARNYAHVELTPAAKEKITSSRLTVEKAMAKNEPIYGLNTGFGKFENVAIDDSQLNELQLRLILADCVGVGDPFPTEVVRAIMLLRVNALAKGYSGIRLSTVETLVSMINKRVHPVIPEKGSVGSSGDLCPLAHMVMPLIGEGEAEFKGEIVSGLDAMNKAGITPVKLTAKEGLALINGTCAMMGVAAIAVYDAYNVVKTADIISALTCEALTGISDPYDERIHKARPHSGQIDVAYNLRKLLHGSKLTTRQGEKRVQDAYTLRCIPQIHGASRLALDYVRSVITTEINSATDNPLIFTDNGDIISGGNFHGQPVAIAMDTLGIAMAEIADVSERRIERLVNPALSNGLPAFLVANGGLNCGFMVPQYCAAALVSENKILAHPASVDSIPTSANQEDHVSFGTIAARKARQIIEHAFHVLSIEFICAAQGIDLRENGVSLLSDPGKFSYNYLRKDVSYMKDDRAIYPDMEKSYKLIYHGDLVKLIENSIGKLH
ncbi:MAG: histidine ammonia-lyase [Acidaminococcus sp.]|jgi:histidine ammonia-lyase|nr:histidine ammonia-lyase [Acidaminococcus sp.]